MAKATHAGGHSFTEHEWSDPEPTPLTITRPILGEVDRPRPQTTTEDGGDSTPSSASELTKSADENQSRQSPAQTMGNPSSTPEAESSSADSTDGSGQTTQGRQSASPRKATKKAVAPKAAKPADDDFDDF